MSPFRVRGVEFRYDTVLGIVLILIVLIFGFNSLVWQLKENAKVTQANATANRRVLEDILQRMNDNTRLVQQVNEVAIQQRVLQNKAEELFQMIEEQKRKR